jgi:hypothetical protein
MTERQAASTLIRRPSSAWPPGGALWVLMELLDGHRRSERPRATRARYLRARRRGLRAMSGRPQGAASEESR